MDLHEGNRIGGGSVKADGERGGAIVWETYLQVSNKHILHTTKNNRLTWKESVVRYWREAVGGWDWWWFGVKAGCDFNAIELSESNCEIRGRSTRFLRKSLIFGMGFVPEPTWRYEISKWARWLERFFQIVGNDFCKSRKNWKRGLSNFASWGDRMLMSDMAH